MPSLYTQDCLSAPGQPDSSWISALLSPSPDFYPSLLFNSSSLSSSYSQSSSSSSSPLSSTTTHMSKLADESPAAPMAAAPPIPTKPGSSLSAPSSVGSGSTKISKRRSRATSKPPITVLSADKSTFRDMVQKLTGIPNMINSRPPPPSSVLWRDIDKMTRASGLPPFKPLINPSGRPSSPPPLMPTLDTSSAFLNFLHRNYTSTDHHYNTSIKPDPDLGLAQGAYDQSHLSFLHSPQLMDPSKPLHSSSSSTTTTTSSLMQQPSNFTSLRDINSLLAEHASFAAPLPSLGGDNQSTLDTSTTIATTTTATGNSLNLSLAEVEHLNKLRQAAELENLLMLHNFDSWLSSNHPQHAGVASIHQYSPPKVGLAHSA